MCSNSIAYKMWVNQTKKNSTFIVKIYCGATASARLLPHYPMKNKYKIREIEIPNSLEQNEVLKSLDDRAWELYRKGNKNGQIKAFEDSIRKF